MSQVLSIYNRIITLINALAPAFMLVIRLWIAHVFWVSGLVKIDDWDATLFLFKSEYAVPLLPPAVAAFMAASFELACPVFLTLGLGARLAVLPLLGMTAVINFTYQDNVEHYYWAMLLGIIFFHGAGRLSLDHFIKRKLAVEVQHG